MLHGVCLPEWTLQMISLIFYFIFLLQSWQKQKKKAKQRSKIEKRGADFWCDIIPPCFQNRTRTRTRDWYLKESHFRTRVLLILQCSLCLTCSKDYHAPKGIAREYNSNCRSKPFIYLNSVLPEKDKDADLQRETLKINNSLTFFSPSHFHYKAQTLCYHNWKVAQFLPTNSNLQYCSPFNKYLIFVKGR